MKPIRLHWILRNLLRSITANIIQSFAVKECKLISIYFAEMRLK